MRVGGKDGGIGWGLLGRNDGGSWVRGRGARNGREVNGKIVGGVKGEF